VRRLRLHLHEPAFPPRLAKMLSPPGEVTVTSERLVDAPRTVAIVGSRDPTDGAVALARKIADAVARAGAVVVSGGAVGIDAAAHEAAMDAGGRTWLVAPCGSDRVFPKKHADLFERVAAHPESSVLWPFASGAYPSSARFLPFLERNRILVGLADAVVVVQAHAKSGTRNTAHWARKLGKPLWIVPIAPWDPCADAYPGWAIEVQIGGALVWTGLERFMSSLELKTLALFSVPARSFSKAESQLLRALSSSPKHADELALESGLDAPSTATALLTLALENVVVEGPGGFYRRVTA
jgi:DNA processing protein